MQKFKTAAMSVGVAVAGALFAPGVHAIDLTSGDWKFSVNGNVNVHYIYSSCEKADQAAAIVTVGGACTGSATGSSVSNVGNGLLPAALTFGISTTQMGWDIAAHFGFYPGINSNDGGSPNLQASTAQTNVALATTGLDVRQVYLTFGNANVGTFTFGRNFGLFGFDAIINDMTIPGVGVAGSMSTASPANTSLGSIGFGYIYTDTYAQMNYTTPKFAGFDFTAGIFDPLNSLTDGGTVGTNQPKKAPGFHFKATYTLPLSDVTKLYFSASGLTQKQDYITAGLLPVEYTSSGMDVFGKIDVASFEFAASYYYGIGLGTTGLFVLSDDGAGHARKSNGYLLQATYAFGPTKVGVNYGVSRLEFANGTDTLTTPNLLYTNNKVTAGVYYSLVKNLTLLGEVSRVWTDAQNGLQNKSINANAGAFLSF